MNDAVAMNVAQAIENLSEQAPGAVYIVVQAVLDQITQCLDTKSVSEYHSQDDPTHMFLAILHLDIERSQDRSTVRTRSCSADFAVFGAGLVGLRSVMMRSIRNRSLVVIFAVRRGEFYLWIPAGADEV